MYQYSQNFYILHILYRVPLFFGHPVYRLSAKLYELFELLLALPSTLTTVAILYCRDISCDAKLLMYAYYTLYDLKVTDIIELGTLLMHAYLKRIFRLTFVIMTATYGRQTMFPECIISVLTISDRFKFSTNR